MKIKIVFSAFLFFFLISNQTYSQWTACAGLDGMNVSSIEVLDSIICIEGGGGVYYRHINDSIWLNSISNESYSALVSTDSAFFLLGTFSNGNIFLRSLDLGKTWQEVDYDGYMVYDIATIQNNIIIIDVDSLIKSDDNGYTWNNINFTKNDFSIDKLFVSDTILFINDTYGDSLVYTLNLGNTWTTITKKGLQAQYRWVSDIVSFNDSIYAATNHGVFVFINNVIGWEIRSHGMEESADINDFDVYNDTLYCACETGIYKYSVNEWKSDNNGLENTEYNCLTRYGFTRFCGSNWGPFQKNEDSNWFSIYEGLNHLDIYSLASHDDIIWVCTNKGLFKSEDLGITFEKLDNQDFSGCEKIVTTDSVYYLNSGKTGIFISKDFGETWINISGVSNVYGDFTLGSQFIFVYHIDLMRADYAIYEWEVLPNWVAEQNIHEIEAINTTIIATVYNDASFTSVDNGISFAESLPSPAYEIGVWNDQFYAISPYNHLKISSDGMNWIDHPFPDDEWYANTITVNSEAIFVGGSLLGFTLYDLMCGISYDGGFTWAEVSDGLPVPSWPIMNQVNMFDYRMFAAPSGQGLWYRDDLLVGNREEKIIDQTEIVVYPNPVTNNVTIDFGSSFQNKNLFRLYDLNGNILREINNFVTEQQIDLSDLSPGIYFLQVIGDSKIASKKIIKQ